MGYTQVALEDRLLDMYPEIREQGLSMYLSFSEERDAWLVRLGRKGREIATYLDKRDADECMDGLKCVSLGVKIGEFLKGFEQERARV